MHVKRHLQRPLYTFSNFQASRLWDIANFERAKRLRHDARQRARAGCWAPERFCAGSRRKVPSLREARNPTATRAPACSGLGQPAKRRCALVRGRTCGRHCGSAGARASSPPAWSPASFSKSAREQRHDIKGRASTGVSETLRRRTIWWGNQARGKKSTSRHSSSFRAGVISSKPNQAECMRHAHAFSVSV